MKKYIIGLTSFLISLNSYSQTGVQTRNPLGVLHIDGKQDNGTSSSLSRTQIDNDVLVNSNGNLGIGTTVPNRNLHINTTGVHGAPVFGFQLKDGTQNNNYVLSSDATGTASWKPVSPVMIKGVFPSSTGAGDMVFTTSTKLHPTQAYIDLPKGVWKIDIVQLLAPGGTGINSTTRLEHMWFRFTFSDGPTLQQETADFVPSQNFDGRIVSGLVKAGWPYGLAQGSIYVDNKLPNKRYYLICGTSTASSEHTDIYLKNVGSNVWAENVIFATSVASF